MQPPTITAIAADPAIEHRYELREFPAPQPLANEALIRVKAISLNRGEIRQSMAANKVSRPGWDFAGIVEQSAADGSGPKPGTRVVGMLRTSAWANLIAAPVNSFAELPEAVSFEIASTLPVAGLTALHSLYKGGFILNRPVLITGATGGTGDFACQLARLAGAKVVATVRDQTRAQFVRDLGVDQVVVGQDPSEAAKFGPYRLIIDSVGGVHFGKVLAMLESRGTCVVFGATAGAEPSINASKFYSTGSTTLYGLILFQELLIEPPSVGLKHLAQLVAQKKVTPHIALTDSWRNIAAIARKLTDRQFTGKAVLTVE